MRAMHLRMRPGRLTVFQRNGFTLVEMMIAIAILAILLSIGVPSMTEAMLGSKLSSFANNFVASANMARSEAIKRNVEVTLCASADGASCATSGGWEQGWVVMCQSEDNVACKVGGANSIVMHRQQALPTGLKMSENSDQRTLAFKSTGVGATGATLKLCRSTPTVGSQERVIRVTATGRASVSKTTSGSCS